MSNSIFVDGGKREKSNIRRRVIFTWGSGVDGILIRVRFVWGSRVSRVSPEGVKPLWHNMEARQQRQLIRREFTLGGRAEAY